MQERLKKIFRNPGQANCPGQNCCGNSLVVDEKLLGLLELLVDNTGKKLYMKYLYKCITFNRSINGGNDHHAKGLAVDIDTIKTVIEPVELANMAWNIGFNAIGVYGTNKQPGYKNKMGMVHLGIEPEERSWGDWLPNILKNQ